MCGAGGTSLKPQIPTGLLHWSRAEAESCDFGKGDSRGAAELETFRGMSEPLPKLELVLDGKNPSCCPASAQQMLCAQSQDGAGSETSSQAA